MRCQMTEGGDPAFLSGREALAHHRVFAGLVHVGLIEKTGVVTPEAQRPAGKDTGERGDIGLGVAGGRADRMQFEAFAR